MFALLATAITNKFEKNLIVLKDKRKAMIYEWFSEFEKNLIVLKENKRIRGLPNT